MTVGLVHFTHALLSGSTEILKKEMMTFVKQVLLYLEVASLGQALSLSLLMKPLLPWEGPTVSDHSSQKLLRCTLTAQLLQSSCLSSSTLFRLPDCVMSAFPWLSETVSWLTAVAATLSDPPCKVLCVLPDLVCALVFWKQMDCFDFKLIESRRKKMCGSGVQSLKVRDSKG